MIDSDAMVGAQSEALLPLCELAVNAGRGGEQVEAFAVHDVKSSLWARDGALEQARSSDTWNFAIRLLYKGRLTLAATSDLTRDGVMDALMRARTSATLVDADERWALPAAGRLPDQLPLVAEDCTRVPRHQKQRLVLALEREALSLDSRVSGVKAAAYADRHSHVAIASTAGVSGEYRAAACTASVTALAVGQDEVQTGFAVTWARRLADLDVRACAYEAVQHGTRLLGGRKPTTQRVSAVFGPTATASLLSLLAPLLTGSRVSGHRRIFGQGLGEEVAAKGISLIDDGRLICGPAARPFDDEGIATRRTTVVADGILSCLLHNDHTARLAGGGQTSTGSAYRTSYGRAPETAASNLFLEGTTLSVADLLVAGGGGVYVQELSGLGSGVDPVSGEMSVGVRGLRVHTDGSLGQPIREAMLSSTLPVLLRSVVALGDDRRFFGDGHAGTTLLVESVTLAGT